MWSSKPHVLDTFIWFEYRANGWLIMFWFNCSFSLFESLPTFCCSLHSWIATAYLPQGISTTLSCVDRVDRLGLAVLQVPSGCGTPGNFEGHLCCRENYYCGEYPTVYNKSSGTQWRDVFTSCFQKLFVCLFCKILLMSSLDGAIYSLHVKVFTNNFCSNSCYCTTNWILSVEVNLMWMVTIGLLPNERTFWNKEIGFVKPMPDTYKHPSSASTNSNVLLSLHVGNFVFSNIRICSLPLCVPGVLF